MYSPGAPVISAPSLSLCVCLITEQGSWETNNIDVCVFFPDVFVAIH